MNGSSHSMNVIFDSINQIGIGGSGSSWSSINSWCCVDFQLPHFLVETDFELAVDLIVSNGNGYGGQEVLDNHGTARINQPSVGWEILFAGLQLVQPFRQDFVRELAIDG